MTFIFWEIPFQNYLKFIIYDDPKPQPGERKYFFCMPEYFLSPLIANNLETI